MKAALLLSLAALVSCTVLRTPVATRGWDVVGPAPRGMEIPVMISLKKDTTELSRRLEVASTPGTPMYREWLSMEEERAVTKIADAKPVLAFFAQNKIPVIQEHDVITATMTVLQVETVFQTRVTMHKSASNGMMWHRAGELHAPADFVAVVAGVYGLHDWPLPPARNSTRLTRQDGNEYPIGPSDIRKRYQVPNGVRGDKDTAIRQAVAEFQGQFMDTDDLTSFFQQYVPFAQSGDENVYAYRGNKQTGYGVEALLDIQYIMGNAPGVLTEFWALRNFDFCSDLKVWATQILTDKNPPLVFSVSYGLQSDVPSFCSNYEDIDTDFQRIAARGISVIFASGDSGSGWDGEQLWPSWPSISPWVTSVGATCFTNMSFTQEQTTEQFGTGSGFSGLSAVPSYQAAAVQKFMQSQQGQLPPDNVWKTYKGTFGRGTADVSALGEGYNVVVQGSTYGVGGTSASTPTFSSLISLINTQLHRQGKKPMGFLNPWIYKNPQMFTDVVLGDDKLDRNGDPVPYGFNAVPGWDPPTGFGTPIYPAMLAAALRG